jgi:hypothetical protein
LNPRPFSADFEEPPPVIVVTAIESGYLLLAGRPLGMAMPAVGVERMVGTQMNKSDSALGAPLAATLDLDPPVFVVVALTSGAKQVTSC